MGEKLLNTRNLYALLDVEPFVIVCALMTLAWVFYKVFLKDVSLERHKNIQTHLQNIFRNFVIFSTLFVTALLLHQAPLDASISRSTPYLALASLMSGMIVFVKTCRLIILQYLFLGSMKHGVPVLIVNIVSLLLSLFLGLWTANSIFGIELTPLLATSAAFSVILGLALQDTLGNLFAGISLQIDRAYDIGDWIEITSGMQKAVGQVKEITWRATALVGWADETIILPNRFLANSQISNFSPSDQPICMGQKFKINHGQDLDFVKKCLLESIKEVKTIRSWPEPLVYISETTESWILLKLVYYVDSFGSQFSIGDQVTQFAIQYLQANNIQIAANRVEISHPLDRSSDKNNVAAPRSL